MENYISQQLLLFCGAALLGLVLGLAYDLLRAVRRRCAALLIACDVLFCIAVAAGMIGYTLQAAGGELRIYLLLGTLLGAVFYFCVLSAPLRPLWDFWMDVAVLFVHVCVFPAALMKKFLQKIGMKAKKLFHFWWKWVKISNYRWEFILIRRRRERSRNHETHHKSSKRKTVRRRRHPGQTGADRPADLRRRHAVQPAKPDSGRPGPAGGADRPGPEPGG